MLGRPRASFRGLGHGPRKLVDRVANAVAGDWCGVYHGSSDHLGAPLLLLVQELLLQMVQIQFQPYSEGVRGVAAFYTVALYHVLRVVFLADGDGPFLMVAGDVHAKGLLKSLHDEPTLVGTARPNFQHSPSANNLVSHRDRGNRYQCEDAVLLQTRDLFVRCCLPTRRLGKTHGLLDGVRATVRFSPYRTARLSIGPGIGDFSSDRLGIKLMSSIQCICVGVET